MIDISGLTKLHSSASLAAQQNREYIMRYSVHYLECTAQNESVHKKKSDRYLRKKNNNNTSKTGTLWKNVLFPFKMNSV